MSPAIRPSGRAPDALRPVRITRRYTKHAEGAVLMACGDTQVICTASILDKVPPHVRGTGAGWLTAEYGMLPRATHTRGDREAARGKQSGRTLEIQRLIGRALRAAVSLESLDGFTITIDCDVLQADGGTRTASITGGYVALALALRRLVASGHLAANPLQRAVAAVSAGYVTGYALLDLDYSEDSMADLDCNLVLTGDGAIVEVQCTAEARAVDRAEFDRLIDLATDGVHHLLSVQQAALDAAP